MTAHSIVPVQAVRGASEAAPVSLPAPPTKPAATSFSKMFLGGIDQVNQKVSSADAMAQSFALNDNPVAPHQIAYALEQARMSVELMMQVRNQVVAGYQEIMRMQL